MRIALLSCPLVKLNTQACAFLAIDSKGDMPYALKRLLLAIPVAWVIASLVFLSLRLLPGNPADLVLGEQADVAAKTAWTESHGLNDSIASQYARYLKNLLHGDMGLSFTSNRAVSDLIVERYPQTAHLAATAMVIALVVALPLGMVSARHRNRLPDHVSRIASLLGISAPTLFMGPIFMLLFAVYLGWLPVSGNLLPGASILPSLTLGLAMAAFLSRITRSALLDTLHEDFIRTAKAKGVSRWTILFKHALKPAMTPIVSVMGLQVGALLAGAVVTEKIFAWPGMGSLLVESIQKRDYSVVQGCMLTMSLSYVAVNLATDLVIAVLDPRISLTRLKGAS